MNTSALQHLLAGRTLNEMQTAALEVVRGTTRHTLIVATTGSGKSLVFEIALLDTVLAGGLGVYLAPLKAIASEKKADWDRLAEVGIRTYRATGDDDAFDAHQARAAHLVLATPEKWDGVLRRGLPDDLLQRCRLIVVDEIHTIGEGSRGARLEALLARILVQMPGTRLIGLSATVPNYADLAHWLNAAVYHSTWRAVPLVTAVHAYTPTGEYRRDQEVRTRLTARLAAEELGRGGVILVFCGSRHGVEDCAEALARSLRLPAPTASSISTPKLKTTLARGVGYHHAGLPRQDRQAVETLFRQGTIRCVVATSTLASGINMPASAVIMRDLMLGTTPMNAGNLLQACGRAGRQGLAETGYAHVIAAEEDVARVHRMLQGEPVVSQLGVDLATHLNTEIAVGIVADWPGLENWYANTLHGRMKGDLGAPKRALGRLLADGFVIEDAGRFCSTPLGKATSTQMLRVATTRELDRVIANWPDDPLNADSIEERLLFAVCQLSQEWGEEINRPDQSTLVEALPDYDRRLGGWEQGRLRMLGVAICLLGAVPLETVGFEEPWSVTHEVRADLTRLLRFVARRALDCEPPLPHVGLAAADLAAALEFDVHVRGAAPLLEAIKRGFPAQESRGRLVSERYRALRAGQDLAPHERRFLAAAPALDVQIEVNSSGQTAGIGPLPANVRVYTRVNSRGGSVRRCTTVPSGAACVLEPSSTSGSASFIELVAVAPHPLLWRYARADVEAPALLGNKGKQRHSKPASPNTWRVLEHYAAEEPRNLPVCKHLKNWHPVAVAQRKCPRCGQPMYLRNGVYGPFWGCSGYPDCKATSPA